MTLSTSGQLRRVDVALEDDDDDDEGMLFELGGDARLNINPDNIGYAWAWSNGFELDCLGHILQIHWAELD
ncbi:MAG: hypothetical protein M3355_10810 [Actinomycetota bacterium]|nr:hypothetical protein [Actinomycetota bacterium]